MIIRWLVRVAVWGFVLLLVAAFLYHYAKPKYIYQQVTKHPLLQEFKSCQLVQYEFIQEKGGANPIKDYIDPRYRAIDFYYIDPRSDLNIKYNYMVHAELNGPNVARAAPDWGIELSDSNTVAAWIKKLESDSTLAALIKNTDAAECRFDLSGFVYRGPHDMLKYNVRSGVIYLKLKKPPAALYLPPYTQAFENAVKGRGFNYGDFDSLRFFKVTGRAGDTAAAGAWLIQCYAAAFKKDYLEVGTDGRAPVSLRFLSDPDSIDPLFLSGRILKYLAAAGLPGEYVKENLSLNEVGANRHADYYKKDGKIVDATRVVGYYQFKWVTESWFDLLRNRLLVRLYFTHFMDRDNIESVHVGTSPANFHNKISLHPVSTVIDLDLIKQVAPWIDTTKTGFKITRDGRIMLTFDRGREGYEVDIERGAFIRQRLPVKKLRIIPKDQLVYEEMERTINARRGIKEQ